MESEQGVVVQQIALQGTDDQNVYDITGTLVNVSPSAASASSRTGSNKIRVEPINKFDFDTRYTLGNLVAVHHSFSLVAIALNRANEAAAPLIRIRNVKEDIAVLLRGFEGRVIDLSFSYAQSETLLAALDERGTLFVFRVSESQTGAKKSLEQTLVLRASHGGAGVKTTRPSADDSQTASTEICGRVMWTRYIADEEEDNAEQAEISAERLAESERAMQTLLFTYNDNCTFLDVSQLVKKYTVMSESTTGSPVLNLSEQRRFVVSAEGHTRSITDAQISPDASAFATASMDGFVRFYNVSLDDLDPVGEPMESNRVKQPMHAWSPHDGKPVTCLRFLDNFRDPSSSVWRYALTAADSGRELKFWLCTKWRCVQTVRFSESRTALKFAVDDTAQLVVAADVRRHVMYVLHLALQDEQENDDSDEPEKCCACVQLAEFILSVPCLSFGFCNSSPTDGSVTEINVLSLHARNVQQMSIRYTRPAHTNLSVSLASKVNEITKLVENLGLDLNGREPLHGKPNTQTSAVTPGDRTEQQVNDAGSPRGDGIETQLIGPDAFLSASSSTLNESVKKPASQSHDTLAKSADVTPKRQGAEASPKGDALKSPVQHFTSPLAFSSTSAPAQPVGTILGIPLREVSVSQPSSAQLSSLETSVRRLNDTVAQLAQSLQSHQQRVDSQLTQLSASQQRIPNGATQSNSITAADLKALLDKHETAVANRFERELRRVNTAIEQLPKQPVQSASAALSDSQLAVLRDATRQATSECVAAAQKDLRSTLEAVQKDNAAQIGSVCSKFDAALNQELAKWLNAKSTSSQISQAVAAALRNEALSALTESFERAALPAFQRSTDALFTQLNQTFQKGVTEWLAHVNTVGDASNAKLATEFDRVAREALERLEREASKSLGEAARAAVSSTLASSSGDSLADSIAQAVVTRLKPELVTQLNDSVAGALGRSRAQTPSADKRCDPAHLTQLVNERRFNDAFQEALSVSSLPCVLQVCEQVRPSDLFAMQPCPLQQQVLLSLVQQLSVGLDLCSAKQLLLRVEYIQNALTCLDPNNTTLRDYYPRIVKAVSKSVDACLQKSTFAECSMQLRTLRMLTQSFVANK